METNGFLSVHILPGDIPDYVQRYIGKQDQDFIRTCFAEDRRVFAIKQIWNNHIPYSLDQSKSGPIMLNLKTAQNICFHIADWLPEPAQATLTITATTETMGNLIAARRLLLQNGIKFECTAEMEF